MVKFEETKASVFLVHRLVFLLRRSYFDRRAALFESAAVCEPSVFALLTVLLLCKSRVNGAVKSKWLSGGCLAVSLLLLAAVWLSLPISPGLPGSNSFSLSAMLVAGCAVDLVDSLRTKK